jgi:tetratricopeptide (TPR) repeat protein
LGLIAAVFTVAAGCTPKTPPVVAPSAAWRVPAIPSDLSADPQRARFDTAWRRVQRGDIGGGEKVFEDIARRSPGFYPAVVSLGELRLRRQQYAAAAPLFDRALAINPSYLPALNGLAEAKLGAGDDAGAFAALTKLVAADPSRTDASARLEVVRLRVAQAELDLATRARADNKLDEAALHLQRAMEATPQNGAVLRASSALELAMGREDVAEARAREAIAIDPQDAEAFAALGDALDVEGRLPEAVAAYERAFALDPRPAWRERRESLATASATRSLPVQYRAITQATAVTRADVAAMLGVRLAGAVSHAPDRSTTVVTDTRGQWAARWILPVVRAGWMEPLPNHTFQPADTVHRAELAAIVAAVLTDVAALRPRDLAKWQTARPVFADITRDHASYTVASIAVSSGVMTAEGGRFAPARAVSGVELAATIRRLEQLQSGR